MALWNKLYRSKLGFLLSSQFKRFPEIYLVQDNTSASKASIVNHLGIRVFLPANFGCTTKFYGSQSQARLKVDDTNGPILNEMIDSQYVRLVTEEGHDVLPTFKARELARKLNLDLVLVQRDADPPVCKIYDYKKEQFQQKVKEKERNKAKASLRKGDCKEVRFSVKTEPKDLKVKADTIKRLIVDGYRVKCVAMPSKATKKMISQENTEVSKEVKALFDSLLAMIEDEAIIESELSVKNGIGHIIVRHVKFGPAKKPSQKSKDAKKSTSEEITVSDGNNEEIEKYDECVHSYSILNPADCVGALLNTAAVQEETAKRDQLYPPNRNSPMPSSPYQRLQQMPPFQAKVAAPTENNRYVKKPIPSQQPNNLEQQRSRSPSIYPRAGSGAVQPRVTPDPTRGIVPGRQVAVETNRYANKSSSPNSDFDNRSSMKNGIGRFHREEPTFRQKEKVQR